MDLLNKVKKFSSLQFSIGLILVGLLLSIFSGIGLLQPERETAPVKAEITAITETGTQDNTEYHVTVDYQVEGKTYSEELGAYQSNWNVGDEIDCHYEVDHPERIQYGNGKLAAWVVFTIGLAALLFGIVSLIRSIKKPSSDYAQYDRIDKNSIDPVKREEVENNEEPLQEYVFHFTGKMNQSYVMKDSLQHEVFRADCGGIRLLKDTDYDFIHAETGSRIARKIGHTVTAAQSGGISLFPNVSSSFSIDGQNCWDFLAEKGYGFDFSLNKLKCHYEVRHYGVPVGSIEMAGSEAADPKYEGNKLAQIPTNGIFRISCQPSEAEGFFYICFCIAKTEVTLT